MQLSLSRPTQVGWPLEGGRGHNCLLSHMPCVCVVCLQRCTGARADVLTLMPPLTHTSTFACTAAVCQEGVRAVRRGHDDGWNSFWAGGLAGAALTRIACKCRRWCVVFGSSRIVVVHTLGRSIDPVSAVVCRQWPQPPLLGAHAGSTLQTANTPCLW